VQYTENTNANAWLHIGKNHILVTGKFVSFILQW